MKFRHNPFESHLSDILPSALQKLFAVSDGWYVEYKSQAIAMKAIAKSLSAFANQYGGWLVFSMTRSGWNAQESLSLIAVTCRGRAGWLHSMISAFDEDICPLRLGGRSCHEDRR